MKKIQMMIIMGALLSALTGCTNYAKEYNKNTVVIKGNGSLVEVAVEDFKDSSIKAEELTTYIDEQITSYNEEAGKNKVRKKSINTDDMSKVKLVLTYKDIESYNGFNALECTLKDFSDVKESELKGSFKAGEDKTVKVSDMEDVDKATVLIISEATDIVVNGSILYYNGEVKVKDNVATTSGKDNAIIIFK